MKIKIKSWEELLICGIASGEDIEFRDRNNDAIFFSCKMKHLCGNVYEVDSLMDCDGWELTEAMIEPLETPKALNYNKGKIRPSLILKDMLFAFRALLDVRENGCIKYDRLNFLLSLDTEHAEKFLEDNLESIERHYLDIMDGQIFDKESKCFHYAHIAIRSMFAIMYLQKKTADE